MHLIGGASSKIYSLLYKTVISKLKLLLLLVVCSMIYDMSPTFLFKWPPPCSPSVSSGGNTVLIHEQEMQNST
jgi:hypothetical protein